MDGFKHSDGPGRRRVPRKQIRRRIGLLVEGKYYLSLAYEIGEGGMLIDAPVTLVAGQRAVTTFRIPNVLQGVMLCRVVYVLEPKATGDKVKYGLQFDNVEFDVKRKIRNYVASTDGDNTSQSIEEEKAFKK